MERPENPASIYLDSSALLLVITKQAGYEPVRDVLELADEGKLVLYASALVYVEVRGQGLTGTFDPEIDKRALSILESPRLVKIEFHRRLALMARRYAQTEGLKNWDAVHLASAVEAKADVLMTGDARFRPERLIDGVWVDRPYTPGDPRLFTGKGTGA